MTDLTVVVISYKRPHLLKDTLDSIKQRVDGLTSRILVIDNSTNEATRQVIEAANVDEAFYLSNNRGINWPLEHLVAPILDSAYVCVSDHDMYYARSYSIFCEFLEHNPHVQYAKGCDSVEHKSFASLKWCGEDWRLKHTERGGGVIMSSSRFRSLLPLRTSLLDFDWSLSDRGGPFAVLPGTVAHVGYKESTWQCGEVAEPYILVDGVIVPYQKPC